ncbi:MAG TPA: hypothetical protein PLC38_05290 [Methanobacterium sp.]|nr:MAG: hypothetical protein FGO69_09290 [Methanobacterium sp.]HOI71683.1 hypothetical protein [Methanobacterium sp.]
MNKTRVTASILGIFAGLGGGVFHGVGEILQGNTGTNAIYIQAWPVMQATSGEPAMTLIPNFLITGVLAVIIGIIVTIWAAAFIERKHGGLILILLTIIMLLFGGGIIPPIIGIAGGIIGTRINKNK